MVQASVLWVFLYRNLQAIIGTSDGFHDTQQNSSQDNDTGTQDNGIQLKDSIATLSIMALSIVTQITQNFRLQLSA